jgi:hypothetical protein
MWDLVLPHFFLGLGIGMVDSVKYFLLLLHKVTNGRLIISRTFLPVNKTCEQSFYCILSNCKMLGDFLSIQLQQFLRFIQLLILGFAYISLFNSQYLIQ